MKQTEIIFPEVNGKKSHEITNLENDLIDSFVKFAKANPDKVKFYIDTNFIEEGFWKKNRKYFKVTEFKINIKEQLA